jgi:hypothetical protein
MGENIWRRNPYTIYDLYNAYGDGIVRNILARYIAKRSRNSAIKLNFGFYAYIHSMLLFWSLIISIND